MRLPLFRLASILFTVGIVWASVPASAKDVQAVDQVEVSALLGEWRILHVLQPTSRAVRWAAKKMGIPAPEDCSSVQVVHEKSQEAGLLLTVAFSCPLKPELGSKTFNIRSSSKERADVVSGKMEWDILPWWPSYWVLDKGDKNASGKYRYLVIGGKNRQGLYILANKDTTQLDKDTLRGILSRLDGQGYEDLPARLVPKPDLSAP